VGLVEPAGRSDSTPASQEKKMDSARITAKVKQTINSITGIEIEGIADSAAYKDDLGVDSLAILEIAIDLGKEFGLALEQEELAKIETVQDTINLIIQRTCAQVT
jgi:acyl carrier protein